jgi:hypothetical protein
MTNDEIRMKPAREACTHAGRSYSTDEVRAQRSVVQYEKLLPAAVFDPRTDQIAFSRETPAPQYILKLAADNASQARPLNVER